MITFFCFNNKVLANQGLAQVIPVTHASEVGHFSDTTASAAESDDEGSTAATDGSTLRTSPAEQVSFVPVLFGNLITFYLTQGGSAGSESGGSGVESITGEHNVSGRSSAYGDNMQEAISMVARSENSSILNTTFLVSNRL